MSKNSKISNKFYNHMRNIGSQYFYAEELETVMVSDPTEQKNKTQKWISDLDSELNKEFLAEQRFSAKQRKRRAKAREYAKYYYHNVYKKAKNRGQNM